MKNLKTIIGAAALSLCLATGCAKTTSSNVNQSQVYTAYSASYRYGGSGYPTDSSTAILSVGATFNVAGSTGTYLQLDGQSQVTVNGTALSEDTDFINQVSYSHKKSGALDADAALPYAFVYTDNDGKQYQNTLTLPPAIMVTNTAGTSYALAGALHVGWSSANSVATSETLTAYLEKIDGTYMVSSQSASTTGTTGEIVMDASSLQPATAGTALLSVCREQFGSPAQAPSVGGSIDVTRCSPKITVILH